MAFPLNKKSWTIVAGLAVAALFAAWLLLDSGKKQRGASVDTWEEPEDPVRSAEPAEVANEPSRPLAPPRAEAAASARAEPDLDVVGPSPDDPHEHGMVPHPLDDEHARIASENRLIQRLNDAMSFRKVKEMREMLVEYQKLDPTDVERTQAGYKVVADCIEFPGQQSLAAAHQFYDTQRHSQLRRFVRRICFENSN